MSHSASNDVNNANSNRNKAPQALALIVQRCFMRGSTTVLLSFRLGSKNRSPFKKVVELTRAECPLIIAIHGLPGCGKSYTLIQLQHLLPSEQYLFFECSTILAKLSRGFERFEDAGAEQKQVLRTATAQEIARECTVVDKAGVVTGFPYQADERHADAQDIDSPIDCSHYSCVLFLHVPVQVLTKRRMLDAESSLALDPHVKLDPVQLPSLHCSPSSRTLIVTHSLTLK